jgi:hypothetical protein
MSITPLGSSLSLAERTADPDSAITISRVQGQDGDSVRVQIYSDSLGFILAVEMPLEGLARALTAERAVPCKVIRFNKNNA